MSRQFAQIVREQAVDRRRPGRRAFDARNVYTLAARLRSGALNQPRKHTLRTRLKILWWTFRAHLRRPFRYL